ncbi:MAG: TolB-like 6-bladed beta-propeller domain-containing protein [Prevotellaceae bacterium]|jgi:hypothetical protein|nr:TolB-like 6-bladed beta-propeller domain-containing protein [Prevotellaceae bacterium]
MKKIYVICLLAFASCAENDERTYFNGEVTIIDINVKPDTLRGKEIKLDGLFAGNMWAQDSLIGFIDHRFPDYFMHVFNLYTGKFLYPLCRHGEGPGAFREITFTDQLVMADGQLHFWVRDDYGRKGGCILVNLEKPDNEVKQAMDIIVDDWKFYYSFSFVFILNDSLFLGNNQGEGEYEGKNPFIPPTYYIYNSRTKQKIRTYTLYNGFVSQPEYRGKSSPAEYFASMDRIKPDKSKLAMAMHLLDQINILDLTTGKIKGFRDKNSPDFEYLTHDPADFKRYYSNVCVDDTYIYRNRGRTVNVFDWNGNVVRKIILDKKAIAATFDSVNKYLYAYVGDEGEEVYRDDLSFYINNWKFSILVVRRNFQITPNDEKETNHKGKKS